MTASDVQCKRFAFREGRSFKHREPHAHIAQITTCGGSKNMTQPRNERTPEVKEAKVTWDCTLGEPDKFMVRLDDIRATMDAFEARGLKTRFAMIVRGPASKLVVQSPPPQPTPELQKAAGRIAPLLKELAARGLLIEQCGIALGRQGVRREDLLPLVTVIQNSFVSIVDYQLQGYAYMPIDR